MLPTIRPLLNTYLLHDPDITAEEMGLPEKNVRVGTGFPEALEIETLAASFILIFFFNKLLLLLFAQHVELFDNISLRLCLDHISSENCLEGYAKQQCH